MPPLCYPFWLLSLLLHLLQPVRSKGLGGQLRHSQANKMFIGQLPEGSYEVVHPFQLRDQAPRERMGVDTREPFLELNSSSSGSLPPLPEHWRRVTLVVRSSVLLHQRLRLQLTLNEHLLPRAPGGGPLPLENCFYQGSIVGDPGSLVALSTCEGLWGMLVFANGTGLGIWPLEGVDPRQRGRKQPHLLFRADWAPTQCGVTGLPEAVNPRQSWGMPRRSRRSRHRRGRLFLEMALVLDVPMMRLFNMSRPRALEYALNAANLADIFLRRELDLRVAVTHTETEPQEQLAQPPPDVQQMLSQLVDFASERLSAVEKDLAVLLTGQEFPTRDRMAASRGTAVCTSRAAMLVQVSDPFRAHQSALSLAHSLGHLLGLDHDSADCGCAGGQCLMAARPGPWPRLSFSLSQCSSARLHSLLSSPAAHLRCVFARPFQADLLRMCGNGVLDPGEECDCGRRDQCGDPCCEPLSCQLHSHAQCASHQSCCLRCQFRPRGHQCRPARSVCDVPELCDGQAGECPADGHLLDGTACGRGGDGLCWRGDCADGGAQCRELWGEGASPGDRFCFAQNSRALEYGHCGRDADGNFVECAPENQQCGLLHCQGGAASPLAPNATAFALEFGRDSQRVQCKVLTNSPLGMVRDGSGCGSGRVCVSAMCLPLVQVSRPVQCPSNHEALACSGHGDCTSTGLCICFHAWAGTACELRLSPAPAGGVRHGAPSVGLLPSAGGPPLSPTGALVLETGTLLAVLLLVGLLLLVLLACLLLFYRRRTRANRRPFPECQKATADEEEWTNGTAEGRQIKFGQMPSWRDERRKRKTNKRVYDALQRITEAANEAESLSLKSRESTALAGALLCQPATSLQSQFFVRNGISPLASQSSAPCSSGGPAAIFSSSCPHHNRQQIEEGADGEPGANVPPPRLPNIQLLMRRLDQRMEDAQSLPAALGPPGSADSGHASSTHDVRESPSLFSDPYRLDLPG